MGIAHSEISRFHGLVTVQNWFGIGYTLQANVVLYLMCTCQAKFNKSSPDHFTFHNYHPPWIRGWGNLFLKARVAVRGGQGWPILVMRYLFRDQMSYCGRGAVGWQWIGGWAARLRSSSALRLLLGQIAARYFCGAPSALDVANFPGERQNAARVETHRTASETTALGCHRHRMKLKEENIETVWVCSETTLRVRTKQEYSRVAQDEFTEEQESKELANETTRHAFAKHESPAMAKEDETVAGVKQQPPSHEKIIRSHRIGWNFIASHRTFLGSSPPRDQVLQNGTTHFIVYYCIAWCAIGNHRAIGSHRHREGTDPGTHTGILQLGTQGAHTM